MTKKPATFRDSGSLIAGLLIGMSIVVTVFVTTVPDPGSTQAVLVIGASIVFALGLVLQAAVTGSFGPRGRISTSALRRGTASARERLAGEPRGAVGV